MADGTSTSPRRRPGGGTGTGTGTGSVYQRRSDGRWVAAVRLPSGRRVVRYAASEPAARRLLAELWQASGRGLLPSRSPRQVPTLGEWWRTWLERKRATLRPATVVAYEYSAGRVVAELAEVRLPRLSPAMVAATFDRLRRGGMGSRSLSQAYTYLSGCLRQAVAEGYLAQNPLVGVERPRHRPRERPTWTATEAERFLATCERSGRALAPLCGLLLLTGLRRGEALGVRWRDVDLAARTLWVRRQRTPRGEGPPKTKAAVRAVPLSERAVALLRKAWERNPNRGPEDVVFVGAAARPPHPDAVRKTLERLCQEANVPVVGVHGLRHVFAALATAGGLDPVALARVMGHRRPSLSLDLYAYSLGLERAAGAVERALGGPGDGS